MKKTLYFAICGIALLATVPFIDSSIKADATTTTTSSQQILNQKQIAIVTSFSQLSNALKDTSITNIQVENDITFTANITNIPLRNVAIDGQGHNLNLGIFNITGADGNATGNLSVQNATISNLNSTGTPVSTFFTTVNQNWTINILGGVTYTGERFLMVKNSDVVFSGKNIINTAAENAWVRNVTFAKNSYYNSSAATEGQFSAFYFNGNLVNGKAVGKVEVQDNSDVNIRISPVDDTKYYYPAFYDKVDQVDVMKGANLSITAAGHALQFIPRADFDVNPSVNVASDATLSLVGRGGGNYSTISFQQPNSSLNANSGSTIYIEGNSQNLFDTAKNTTINVTDATYDFRNNVAGKNLFNATTTTLNLRQVDLNTWGQTGGAYSGTPTNFWSNLSLATIINNNTSSNTTSTNVDAQNNFQISKYGRISGQGNTKQKIDSPVLSPITDKDTYITGTGISGDTIILTSNGTEIGRALVGSDGKWTFSLKNTLSAGTIVSAVQTDGNLTSDSVQQIVTHLSTQTTNYFTLGYWQSYGLVFEGRIDNANWNLSDASTIHKYVNLISQDGSVYRWNVANTNWFSDILYYDGFQAILTYDSLVNIPVGTYKVQIGITGNGFEALQDLNANNPTTNSYQENFAAIGSQTYENKTISCSVENNICYITIK